jgi:hypothetical protein
MLHRPSSSVTTVLTEAGHETHWYRIDEHGEDVQLKQSRLNETYNRRTGVERTNESVKDCGFGRAHARGRVHARARVFLALCLRLVVVITNYERGENPESTIITV